MKIVIITRGRVGKQHTLANLPEILSPNIYICCPPDEDHHWPRTLHEPFPMNYSEKFQWILDGAGGKLSGKVVIMDDDLRFSARDPNDATKLLSATENQVFEGLMHMHTLLNEHPLVGFHPRAMGNNTAGTDVMYDKRINAMQGLNLDLIGKVKVDYYPILADMFLNLTLLTRGQGNAIICSPFWDQVGSSNAPGGCSLHRTWDQQREAVLGLKAMFPEFVTVKEKVVKDGWWGPDKPRYDFIIQWKKAALFGRKLKERMK